MFGTSRGLVRVGCYECYIVWEHLHNPMMPFPLLSNLTIPNLHYLFILLILFIYLFISSSYFCGA